MFKAYQSIMILLLIGYVIHFLPKFIDKHVEKGITKSPLFIKGFLLAAIIWIVIQTKTCKKWLKMKLGL